MSVYPNNLDSLLPAGSINFDEILKFMDSGNMQLDVIKAEELDNNLNGPLHLPEEGPDHKVALILPPEEGVTKVYPTPMTLPSFICNDDYPGDYNFEVYINPHHGKKSPWMYSGSLEKLFITMNQSFPVDFKWDFGCNEKLFVRATPVFSNPQYAQDLVTRCIHHAQGTDMNNKDYRPEIWDHILRCNHSSAMYFGNKINNKHLSVLVPLGQPQAGSDIYRCNYQFMCKNSCVTGMNRRPIEVIFTLEDEIGEVKGRKILGVRVCSCPKRDKEKEEQEHHKDGPMVRPSPIGKKRKMDKKVSATSKDTKEYKVEFNIIGKDNLDHILKTAHALMAAEIVQNGNEQPYKKCMLEIAQKIGNTTTDMTLNHSQSQ